MFGFHLMLTPVDSKENGYQSSPPLVFDAWARWTYKIDAPLSRMFGGRTTMFGDLENSAFSLVTISKTPILFTCFYINDF